MAQYPALDLCGIFFQIRILVKVRIFVISRCSLELLFFAICNSFCKLWTWTVNK